MSTTTVLFPPPLRHSEIDEPIQQWLLSLQNLHPMTTVDTSSGHATETLPASGLNVATGQSNQNSERIYAKTSADANTLTIEGGAGGNVVLTAQYQVARFKSDGNVWLRVG